MDIEQKRELAKSIFERVQSRARSSGWSEPRAQRAWCPQNEQIFEVIFPEKLLNVVGINELEALNLGRFEKSIFKAFKKRSLIQYLSKVGATKNFETVEGKPGIIKRVV